MSPEANRTSTSLVMGVSAGINPSSGVITNARPKRRAYVILPRKYSPLMCANKSPIGTPSCERSRVATANVALGDSTCWALRPRQFAGERRNTRTAILIWYSDCFECRRMRVAVVCAFVVCLLWMPQHARAYGGLSHEAIVDAAWDRNIASLLRAKFHSTDEELQEARAFAYGGCLIQDL